MSGPRLVLGVQPVRELLRAHGKGVRVLLLDEESPRLDGLAKLAGDVGARVERASRADLDRRAKGGMHQGAIAEAPPLEVADERSLLAHLEGEPAPVVMVLDGVVDPQNFGAVIRSAVALGAPWVVWAEHASAPLTPATFRASAGAVERARLVRVRSLPWTLRELASRGFVVALLDPSGEQELCEVDLTGSTALVVGAEDRGAKPAVRKAATHRVRLPMAGEIASLNASVAAAIGLYEISRQRRFKQVL